MTPANERAFLELTSAASSPFSAVDAKLAGILSELSPQAWESSYARLGGNYLVKEGLAKDDGLKEGVTLYPHQQEAVQKVLSKDGNLLLSHPVGSGKTLSAIAAFEKLREHGKATRALVVVPASLRTNFLENGVKKFTNAKGAIFGNAQEIAQGTHASPDKADPHARYHVVSYDMFRSDPKKYIDAAKADTVIYDECFVGCTPILTEYGPVSIKTLTLGVRVWSMDSAGNLELKKVLRVIRREKKDKVLVRVRHESGSFVCTYEHKVWTRGGGYVQAGVLSQDSDYRLCVVRESLREDFKGQEKNPKILQSKLFCEASSSNPRGEGASSACGAGGSEAFPKYREAVGAARFPRTGARENACKKSDALCTCPRKSVYHKEGSPVSYEAGRERARIDATSGNTDEVDGVYSRTVARRTRAHSKSNFSRPEDVQDRPCVPYSHDSSGSGWGEPPLFEGARVGRKERPDTYYVGVESVTRIEQGDIGESCACCTKDPWVYDLEVEENHNYFAGGVLVSNCHRAKTEDTRVGAAMRDARQHHRNFIGLTGSIVSNTPADIVPLVDAMTDGKHMLGNKTVFESRFVQTKQDGSRALKHAPVVRALLAPYVHHVDAQTLATSAPKKIVEEVRVDMSPHQTQLYRFVTDQLDPITKIKLKAGVSSLNNATLNDMFAKLIKLRQLSNSIHTLDTRVTAEKSAVDTPKIKRVLDDIHDHLQETPDGQAVVHTNLIHGGVDVISAGLTARGIDHALFIGKGNAGVNEKTRQQGVKEFQEGKKRVIVLSAAGGEGLDLPNATFMAMVDGHFNPEKINQAEARGVRAGGQAHRPENQRQVLVRRYVSVLPNDLGHKVQIAKNIWDNLAPSQVLARVQAGAPAFYNPFKKEKSTDEWIYGVAKRKAGVNTELHSAIKTARAIVPYRTHEEFEEDLGLDKIAIRLDPANAAFGALLGAGAGAFIGNTGGPVSKQEAERDPHRRIRNVLAGAVSGGIGGAATGLLTKQVLQELPASAGGLAVFRSLANVAPAAISGISMADSLLAPATAVPASVKELVGSQHRTYTDRHVFEKYWEHFGDELTQKEDLNAEVKDKALEARFVRALRDLYAEGAAPTSSMQFRHKDDKPVESKLKFLASEAASTVGAGGMGALSALAFSPTLMAMSAAPAVVGALSGAAARYRKNYIDPGVASAASRADVRKRAKFNDEDLQKLLRGRAVDEVKIKSHAIG